MLAWLRTRFELARHGDGGNLAPMEGLRGAAVFLVFLVHFTALLQERPGGVAPAPLLEAVARIGHSGVDLFFVLSGYLIYGSLIARPRRFVAYMARRLQRIYPPFLAVFALYVALAVALPAQGKLPMASTGVYLLQNLLLLPGLLPVEPLVTVAWSLSYEVFYYLAIPLVIGLLRLRRWPRLGRVVLFAGLAAAIVVGCAIHGGHVRLAMFVAGILLHESLAARRLRFSTGAIVAAVAAAFAIAVLRADGSAGYALRTTALFAAFFVLCHGTFSQPAGKAARAFSWTPLRWLGNMSYSYYLIHGLALKALFAASIAAMPRAALSPVPLAAWLVFSFATTLLPAAVLFLTIERPLSLAPRRPAAGVPSSTAVV